MDAIHAAHAAVDMLQKSGDERGLIQVIQDASIRLSVIAKSGLLRQLADSVAEESTAMSNLSADEG